MSMQCYHCLHASGRPTVNFWNLDLVIFALDCPFQGEENDCAWSQLQEILTKQQNSSGRLNNRVYMVYLQ